MALKRDKKKQILDSLGGALRAVKLEGQSAVFVNFHGLAVSDISAMRHALRAEGISYRVAKKTLLRRALATEGFSGTLPPLDGEIAVAYGGADQLSPARSINAFVKRYRESLGIVGGIFDGTFRGRSEMMAIADIPPRETLYAQIAQLLNSPLTRLAVAVNEIARIKN